MPAPGKGEVEYEYFMGMFSANDPHDLQPGQAQIQINLWSPRQGELVSRPGARTMEWDLTDTTR